jgi:methylated-DNA-[protein]-cysteine S-methyltransferase
MITRGFATFETAIGRCGIAWSDCGVTGFQLPECDAAATRARMARRYVGAVESTPPADVQQGLDAIIELLRGECVDLAFIRLDMDGVPEFHQRVYDVARTIPAGATLTYGQVAQRLGDPGAARAVGQALGRNPFAIIVPCHRVTAAGGKTGGFSASGGAVTKLTLLAIEGAHLF